MKKILVFIALFVLICSFGAFIAWCCGYDFDHRSPDIGFAVFLTIVTASLVSFGVSSELKDKQP